MKVALVTGANKGIGYETVRQLAQKGIFVYLGSRDLEKGRIAVQNLLAEGLRNIEAIALDVTDAESIRSALATIETKTKVLDILINNAGISGNYPQSAMSSGIDLFQSVMDTNLYGTIRVTQAFIDLLKNSEMPRVVNVSTAMASLTMAANLSNKSYSNRLVAYQTSKAALNMYTVNLAYELRDTLFKVNAICPGYTQTDFTNHQGTSTVQEAGQRIIKYALVNQDGPTGKFFSEEYFPNDVCPW